MQVLVHKQPEGFKLRRDALNVKSQEVAIRLKLARQNWAEKLETSRAAVDRILDPK